jgi:hypothetical protein
MRSVQLAVENGVDRGERATFDYNRFAFLESRRGRAKLPFGKSPPYMRHEIVPHRRRRAVLLKDSADAGRPANGVQVAEAGRHAEEEVPGKYVASPPIAHAPGLCPRRWRKPRCVSLQPFVAEKVGDLGLAMGRNIEHVPHAPADVNRPEKHRGNGMPRVVTESLRWNDPALYERWPSLSEWGRKNLSKTRVREKERWMCSSGLRQRLL